MIVLGWRQQNDVIDNFNVNPLFFFVLFVLIDRIPRSTFLTQKVLRPHLGLKLKGRGPVSQWGIWRTWWSRLRPQRRTTTQTRTKTWSPKTVESGETWVIGRIPLFFPACLSQRGKACLLADTAAVASLNSECSQQGRGSWGNLQKGSVQEDLGGTLQGIVAINLIVAGWT